MKNLSVYIPSPRLVVSVLIILAAVTFAVRSVSQLEPVRKYLGISPS